MPRVRTAVLVALVLALASCAPHAPTRAEGAWVRAAGQGATTAAYFTLVNDSDRALELAAVDAPWADSVQVHETVREDGLVLMRQVLAMPVPAGGWVEFKPGGSHVMLFGVHASLTAGARKPLTLRFADGTQLEVMAQVRP